MHPFQIGDGAESQVQISRQMPLSEIERWIHVTNHSLLGIIPLYSPIQRAYYSGRYAVPYNHGKAENPPLCPHFTSLRRRFVMVSTKTQSGTAATLDMATRRIAIGPLATTSCDLPPCTPSDSSALTDYRLGRRPARPAKTPQAWNREEATAQLWLNPEDVYLQYVALQLARNEQKEEEVQGLIDNLTQRRWGLRGPRRTVKSICSRSLAGRWPCRKACNSTPCAGRPIRCLARYGRSDEKHRQNLLARRTHGRKPSVGQDACRAA